MQRWRDRSLIVVVLLFQTICIYSQRLHLTPVLKLIGQPVYRVTQDKYGFIWLLSARQNDHCLLQRYNGFDLTTFKPDIQNPKSLQNVFPVCFSIDNDNKIWIGLEGGGVDVFNSITSEVVHFHHDPRNVSTISSDTVNTIMQDHSGKIWLGTQNGLDIMDKATGKCKHFVLHDSMDKRSVNNVDVLYEDSKGELWVGFGNPFNSVNKQPDAGGLYRFNLLSGTFTRYAYAADSLRNIHSRVTSIFEDSKGIMWIGTSQNHLYSMDKSAGEITQHFYNAAYPESVSAPQQKNSVYTDFITAIKEDVTGALWICTSLDGFNRYDPLMKTCTHFGRYFTGPESFVTLSDTSNDYNEYNVSSAFIAKDGMVWISTGFGFVYNVNPANLRIPFVDVQANANAFYQDTVNNILWIGTNKGLIKKDLQNKVEKVWRHQAGNKNSISGDTITNIKCDNGILWMSIIGGGLCRFDPANNTFNSYLKGEDSTSISNNLARNLWIDHNKNIWVGTYNGLNLFNMTTEKFKRFFHNDNDSTRPGPIQLVGKCDQVHA